MADSYNFTTLSGPLGATLVQLTGINSSGEVIGFYDDSSGNQYGFTYDDGTYTPISGPQGSGANLITLTSINSSGEVTGYYSTATSSNYVGFIYQNGTYTVLSGTATTPYAVSEPSAISDLGEVVGNYQTASDVPGAFIYDAGTGTYTTPPAPPGAGAGYPSLEDVNSSGEITGYYYPANSLDPVSFTYSDGTYTTIPSPSGAQDVRALHINNSGEVIGEYGTSNESELGFIYENGTTTTLTGPPGYTETEVIPDGINDSGEVTGNSSAGAFVYDDGVYTLLSAPAGSSSVIPRGIDSAGDVVGYYVDSNGDQEGFIAEPVCFASGTRIRTVRGGEIADVAVEDLAVGDLIVTASGDHRPIRWLGHRTTDCRRHPRKHEVHPVHIAVHAFGENCPIRDLYLSPGHSVCVDIFGEVLVTAGSLVNGSTIQQVEVDEITYWHFELDRHELILGEGLPCESYLDMGNRRYFVEADAVGLCSSPDAPRRTHADFCRPFHPDGPVVDCARTVLRRRAESLGFRLTTEGHAHLIVDGKRIDPIRMSDTRLAFVLPPGGQEITLCSNVFIPAHTVAESSDQRELGLCVGRLQIDGSSVALYGEEACEPGWREAEFIGGRFAHRWTNGAAPLPHGARTVIVDLAGVGHYWIAPEEPAIAMFA